MMALLVEKIAKLVILIVACLYIYIYTFIPTCCLILYGRIGKYNLYSIHGSYIGKGILSFKGSVVGFTKHLF